MLRIDLKWGLKIKKINLKLKSFPKINICLNVSQMDGVLHKISSRFILYLSDYYDCLNFKIAERKNTEANFKDLLKIPILEIKMQDSNSSQDSNNSNILDKNTIIKTFALLNKKYNLESYLEHMELHITLYKNIKIGGGLGGGSSNAAITLLALNNIFNLNLTYSELLKYAFAIGSDVSFFIMIYTQEGKFINDFYKINLKRKDIFLSANVKGYGDILEKFIEPPLKLKIHTNNIYCSTKDVFDKFDKMEYKSSEIDLNLDSKTMLKNYNLYELNNLYASANELYNLESIKKKIELKNGNVFFSGSGSSFFSYEK